jgi:hypothetical protein
MFSHSELSILLIARRIMFLSPLHSENKLRK